MTKARASTRAATPNEWARLVREIDAACRRLADPARAAKYARYFTEGWDAYGVDHGNPEWVRLRREWFEAHRDLGLDFFLPLGKSLFSTGKYEHGALAIHFVAQYLNRLGPKAVAGIATWFDGGVRNWAHTDVLCGELLAPRLRSGAVTTRALARWRSSPHKFQRRAVPVAMLGLVKTATGPGALLEFLRPMMLDQEKVVQQGLGWFLRELWKKHPSDVEAFLLEWKDTAPRLIFQYATEKMSTAARGRFRRATKAGSR
jgi:3-methyladenine DNA glycosylase AlkD